jgi:hypothetical protein
VLGDECAVTAGSDADVDVGRAARVANGLVALEAVATVSPRDHGRAVRVVVTRRRAKTAAARAVEVSLQTVVLPPLGEALSSRASPGGMYAFASHGSTIA